VPKKIGGSVSAPVLIYSVEPEYTAQAKADKVGGIVLINFWVDEQGRPEHVRVRRGLGEGLDEKAVEAVKQYRFNPAMEGGKPVLAELNIEVNFKIF
jgi:protein TonB